MTETADNAAKCPMTLPTDRGLFDPPPSLAAVRESSPITRMSYPDRDGWLVTGYDAAKAVLSDPRFVSWPGHWPVHNPDRTAEGLLFQIQDDQNFPESARQRLLDFQERGVIGEALLDEEIVSAVRDTPPRALALIQSDGARHTQMRRALSGFFTPRRVEEHREFIQNAVENLLDEMQARGSADLVADFTLPLASMTICSLFGVDPDERERFEGPTKVLLSPVDVDPAEDMAARMELFKFAADLVEAKKASPGDDVPSRLLASGAMPEDLLVGTVVQLLTAGHDTTTAQLALGVLALLEDRRLWDSLVSGEADLNNAIEELLRYLSIVQLGGAPRTALEDVEVAGVVVKAGERVMVSLPAVNRDPEVFDNPDELQLDRQVSHHLAFGFGIHQCIGQQLTRLEQRIGLSELIKRFPTLELAVPTSELSTLPGDRIVYGIEKLPVKW